MTVKQKIIEQIKFIEDDNVFNEIYSFIVSRKNLDKVYVFSPFEIQQLNEGIDVADNNRYYTSIKSEKLISEWLKEKSAGL